MLLSKMNTEITGKKFNEEYKDVVCVKFLNDDLTHFNYTYKNDLNIDTKKFTPYGHCKSGGLYFCTIDNAKIFIKLYGNKFSYVKIPDDARVYVEKQKFKANKIILEKIQHISVFINKLSDDNNPILDSLIEEDAYFLGYITNPSDDLIKKYIQNNIHYVRYFDHNAITIEKIQKIQKYIVEIFDVNKHSIDTINDIPYKYHTEELYEKIGHKNEITGE